MGRLPQVGDHRRGVHGQRAVEPGRVGLLEAELRQQPHRPGQRRPPGEQVGGRHQPDPMQPLRWHRMSGRPVRSVLLLCWRDTGHPAGRRQRGLPAAHRRPAGRSRASTSRCAPRAIRVRPRREVVDGVRINRAGGALLGLRLGGAGDGAGPHRARSAAAGAARRGDRHPERHAVPGPAGLRPPGRSCWCTTATASSGRWRAAGPGGSAGSSSRGCRRRLHRRNQYVTVSLPSARDLTDLGVNAEQIAVVRNGLDEAPADTLTLPRVGRATRRGAVAAGAAQADRGRAGRRRRAATTACPACTSTSSAAAGGATASSTTRALLGISDAVTFHGHVDDMTKHHVLQRCWVHVLPSRKEGWGLAVTEAAQHGVPTIGYRSSGGLTDSIVDGVTGLLVDDRDELVDRARAAADRSGAARSARRQGAGAQRRVLLARKAPTRCATCWSRCSPDSGSAAWSRRHLRVSRRPRPRRMQPEALPDR